MPQRVLERWGASDVEVAQHSHNERVPISVNANREAAVLTD
jgi:hypothetical protein